MVVAIPMLFVFLYMGTVLKIAKFDTGRRCNGQGGPAHHLAFEERCHHVIVVAGMLHPA